MAVLGRRSEHRSTGTSVYSPAVKLLLFGPCLAVVVVLRMLTVRRIAELVNG